MTTKHTLYLICLLSLLLRILFLGNRDLLVEEAYYWNYAMHLDFGYVDHPPLTAILIKFSTFLFGLNEFAVRFPAMISWFVMAYFSYRWTELIRKGTGIYAILLASILPFFCIFSIAITPDSLLLACWSVALYTTYRALYCEDKKAWYYAGIAVGLGLLSKYTMLLFVLTTGIYLISNPKMRVWFTRKEPYLALAIALFLFSPVIYWNATHHWVSFLFQSTRRMNAEFEFTFHIFLGLLVLFLTPLGVMGLYKLLKKQKIFLVGAEKVRFFRFYLLVPLTVFALFSLTHEMLFDWIGFAPLAMIPWLAVLMQNETKQVKQWLMSGCILLVCYVAILSVIALGKPEIISQKIFNKMISWNDLTAELYKIAEPLKSKGEQPIFVAIDSYAIPSELTFYQARQKDKIHEQIPVRGGDLFGVDSLMFNLWHPFTDWKNRTVILVAQRSYDFEYPSVRNAIIPLSPVTVIWGHSQGSLKNVKPYYYQLAQIKSLDKDHT